jgi:hypothetical protein
MRGRSTDIARGKLLPQVRRFLLRARRLLPQVGSFAAFLFLALMSPAPVPAQEPAVPAVTPKTERNLIVRTGWVRLEIVGGRIAVLGHRCGQSRVVQVGEPAQLPYEQLSVQLQTESLVLHYEDLKTDRQLTLDLDDQQRLTFSSTGPSPTGDIKLVQPFTGPLTFTIGRDPVQTYSAATLWHLALAQPHLSEEVLFPLLETLRPHWRLKEQAAGIQRELLSHAGEDVLAERAQWRKWVAQLNSDDFQERQDADQQLRMAGQGVVAWLRRLDRKQLSSEQAGRIQDICQGLADLSTDTPPRVTAWLVDDRSAWMSLLRNEDATIRLAAVTHLTILFGKPLPFNPYGGLSEREQQLAQLRQKFGK